ncbi:oxidoreductase [Salarchaeum sp. JOR-1]|uniref:oxidoreductase n=1 Tax=Salarchaeum sp. JOR-1 TaxID=2599399 RepID=UPI0011984450|nr:oxidoreductase [Salarchaeum sp. JOR-1]QDX41206.1 SDR family NAD(P)-dependent oxidoreductase [Salarchaeum sp. JOR-1]
MSDWTPADMSSQAGKTVLVTGANSGIGFEATTAFAAAGAHVVMACRSTDRGRDAKREIESEYPGASLTVRDLDLADLNSIRAFADWYRAEYDALHVLANNAGVMAIPRSETAQGFETQFGVNHLGHFALTAHLLPVLRQTNDESRVVTQSSGVHERGRIDFDDLQSEDDYDKWTAYAQSKLANVLFAYELDRRLRTAGASVTSVACHPGYAATNLQLRGPEAEGSRLRTLAMKAANAVFAQSAEQGAWPLLYAATNPDIDGGEYIGPTGLFNMRGHPGQQESSERSHDENAARRLWTASEDLTDASYDLPDP